MSFLRQAVVSRPAAVKWLLSGYIIFHAERLGHAFRIGGIGLVKMNHLTLNDFFRDASHGGGDVFEQALFLAGIKQTEQISRLGVVVIAVAVIVAVCIA